MKSTVPPGTGAACRRRLDDRGLVDVPYVACPEFLRESTGLADFADPDRVVIGDQGTWAGDAVERLYRQITTEDRILRMDVTSAETMKLAANAFLATKISFINEMANLCDRAGADVDAVARAMGMDPRVGPTYLRAGIGFGGSCFGKDLAALANEAERLGCPSEVLGAVLRTNERQWQRVLEKLGDHLGDLRGSTVAMLGLAFKPGTSNIRDASSLPLLAGLVAAGVNVRAFDPKVTRQALLRDDRLEDDVVHRVQLAASALQCVAGADAVVLVTEWPEFLGLDWGAVREAMNGSVVVDGRNALDPAAITAEGLEYAGIGRRAAGVGIRARTARTATMPP
jgi:UDPglucose 6-dehydrogenase